ncbi:MAG: gamma carbonic anhydrase family protein [Alphaproteobacteria bacterium]|nr:gamma carbonic anhydrase family protein [Alphaproteobacteria bacterium]MDP6830223.1 gamma carbonic anhydrase family protein [Alphaproteobacteria bacterium]
MHKFGPLVQLDKPAFVHETVEIFGKARIAEGVSIWPRVVMRAEAGEHVIGPYSNLQDFALLHIGSGQGAVIGTYSSIAHRATVHGATIGDNCLIGINATVMDGAVVGDNCIVAPHCIVTAGSNIPPNSVVAGVPGVVVKSRNNYVANRMNAYSYHHNGLAYARGEHRLWDSAEFQAARKAEHARLKAELAAMEAD